MRGGGSEEHDLVGLVLETDNGYKGEIALGICICFKNREQNLLRVDISGNWILC